jgi:hypothetical protein
MRLLIVDRNFVPLNAFMGTALWPGLTRISFNLTA